MSELRIGLSDLSRGKNAKFATPKILAELLVANDRNASF